MTEPTFDYLRPIPGNDPGACGVWRKSGLPHTCAVEHADLLWIADALAAGAESSHAAQDTET